MIILNAAEEHFLKQPAGAAVHDGGRALRRTEEMAHHVRVVDVHVEEAAAGLLLVEEPAVRALPVRRRRGAGEVRRHHLAVLPGVDHRLERHVLGPEAEALAHEEHLPRALRGGEHPVA